MAALFNVLGPVEVVRDGTVVDIGPPSIRFVIGVLALEANRVVPVDRLIDLAWPDEPPPTARTSIQVRVSRLRALLPDDAQLRTEAAGYVLRVDPDRVDAHRFQRLLASADGADDTAAVAMLREALALWRGPVLAGAAGEDVRARLALGLEEARLAATERLAEVELRLGRHASVVDDLYRLVGDHPSRERPVELLARALHAGGQTGKALDLIRAHNRRLADELGLDPGPGLRELETALLRGEPTAPPANPVPATPATPAPARTRPAQLPAAPARYRGRTAALAALDAALAESSDEAAVLVVTGMPGVGKTALALHWAHGAADRFDDGQLFVDLRGHAAEPASTPRDALAGFLRALGAEPTGIPAEVADAAADFRSRVAGQRMLIVLDNAGSAEQVRPLLAGTPGCVTVITSRYRLDALAAHEGARRVTLEPLSDAESRDVLAAALDDRVDDDAGGLVALCGGLPLALRIAAANVSADVGSLADHVRQARAEGRLGYLAVDDDSAVRTAFDVSYERLDAAARRALRYLGLVPGVDATAGGVAALLDGTEVEAGRLLRSLARAHLVDQHRPGRYRLHDLLRAYAVERTVAEDASGERAAAFDRLVDWYVHATVAAVRTVLPERAVPPLPESAVTVPAYGAPEDAIRWLDEETGNLIAAVLDGAGSGAADRTWRLAAAMRPYFVLNHDLVVWRGIADAVHTAAERSDDATAGAVAAIMRGEMAATEFRRGEAEALLTDARRRCRELGWVGGELDVLSTLGQVAERSGDLDAGERCDREGLRIANQLGDKAHAGRALSNLGHMTFQRGRLGEARELLVRGAKLLDASGALAAQANTLSNLGVVYAYLGQRAEALETLLEARDLARRTGRRTVTVSVLNNIADLYLDEGRYTEALRIAADAAALATDLGRPRSRCVALVNTAIAYHGLGRLDEAREHAERALDVARQVGLAKQVAQIQLDLAEIAAAAGDVSTARRNVEEATASARAHGFRSEQAKALLVTASTERAAGDGAAAAEAAERAAAAYQAIGHERGVRRARRLLAELRQDAISER